MRSYQDNILALGCSAHLALYRESSHLMIAWHATQEPGRPWIDKLQPCKYRVFAYLVGTYEKDDKN